MQLLSNQSLLLGWFREAPLNRGYAVSQTKSNTLGLGTDANVSRKLPIVVVLLLDRDINERVFSKHTIVVNQSKRTDRVSVCIQMFCVDAVMYHPALIKNMGALISTEMQFPPVLTDTDRGD